MKSSRRSVLAILAVALVAAIAIAARLLLWTGGDHAGVASIGGPFALIDQDGRAVTDQTYRGRWMLIYFGYTFCPDVCPTELAVVAQALDKLAPGDRNLVAPIFITIDPARDNPAVMKDYVAAFHPAMIGLTGSEEQVAVAMKAYKVYGAKAKSDDPANYTVDHSSILYLVGPDGRFTQHFPHGTSADDLAAALKKHLK